jgi:hypothetical protein
VIAVVTWTFLGTIADNAPAYAIIGACLSFCAVLVRRWVGQMDDATKAYERGRRDAQAETAADIKALKEDQQRMRLVMSRTLSALSNFESMTPEMFTQLRADALNELFRIDQTEGRQ